MAYETVRFFIQGISPLLMHNPEGMGGGSDDGGIKVKRIPTPEEEAEKSVYRLSDGHLYLPAMHFRGALINAGVGQRIGKRAAPGVIASSVLLTQEACPLMHPDTDEPLTEYAIDVRRVVVQGNGVKRARARLDQWATMIEFEYDTDFVTPTALKELMALAGRIVGVGDFRPKCPKGKGGPFGRFSAELAA